MRGTIQTVSWSSKTLAGNMLGAHVERELMIYQPPQEIWGAARLPVIMVLAGYAGTHRSLLGFDPFKPNIAERFDDLVCSGAVQPAILLFPDGMTRLGGSQYINSSINGAFQDYLADEVIQWADQNLPTIAAPEARAVIGRSSGGFGALRLGIERADVFSVIASHAGDSAFDLSILPLLPACATTLDRAGGVTAFLETFFKREDHHAADFETIMMLALAAAYAPDISAPWPHLRLPFDLKTAELDREVWSHWQAHDPVSILDARPEALKNARLVFLDAGNRDEYGLHFGARRMLARLRARGANVVYEEFDGTHRGTGYRYARSLTLICEALAR